MRGSQGPHYKQNQDPVNSTFSSCTGAKDHISMFHPVDFNRCQGEKSMIHLREDTCGRRSVW